MGLNNQDETYRIAFHAAITQREKIYEEFERLKNRRTILEAVARALEPVIYPDEFKQQQPAAAPTTVIEINHLAPNPEIVDPIPPPARPPVNAVTQVYVPGIAEQNDEIQRRIDIAIGRSAAD